jgi:hypothetical protein
MNDPFPCETKVEGVACAGHATHVYRSAHAVRLICDECATAYRLASKGQRKSGIVEFTLLELIPARESLLIKVDAMRGARDAALENERQARAAANLAIEVKEKAMSETSEAWNRLDKMQQTLARSAVMAHIHQEGQLTTDRWVLWADVTSALLAVVAQIIWHDFTVSWAIFGGGVVIAYWVVNFIVQRWWVRPRLAKLNQTEAGIQ